MATPISRSATILEPIISTSTLLPGDPGNSLTLPFEKLSTPAIFDVDIIIPNHKKMLPTDKIILRVQYVINPNGSLVPGQPTYDYPLPVLPATSSPGLPVQTPADTTHSFQVAFPFGVDPGYKVTYWVQDAKGKTWGYGKPWYIFFF
jgi:hypothetical protein